MHAKAIQGSCRLSRKSFSDFLLNSHGLSLTIYMLKYMIFSDFTKKSKVFFPGQSDITSSTYYDYSSQSFGICSLLNKFLMTKKRFIDL